MTSDDATAEIAPGAPTRWREQAVARSLDPARIRAEKRVQRFLDAALELLDRPDSRDFTVQQVVERSGQSLRSFYQYFAGKHELLLALFEEAVLSTAQRLQELIAKEDDPLARLRIFVAEYYRLCASHPNRSRRSTKKGDPNPTAMADFALQLLTEHSKAAAEAFRPLVDLLEQVLADADAAGSLRSGLDHRHTAGVLLQAIMFGAFSSTISGSPPRDGDDDALWDLFLRGLAASSEA
jgi:AcrR family transcriptional regulator